MLPPPSWQTRRFDIGGWGIVCTALDRCGRGGSWSHVPSACHWQPAIVTWYGCSAKSWLCAPAVEQARAAVSGYCKGTHLRSKSAPPGLFPKPYTSPGKRSVSHIARLFLAMLCCKTAGLHAVLERCCRWSLGHVAVCINGSRRPCVWGVAERAVVLLTASLGVGLQFWHWSGSPCLERLLSTWYVPCITNWCNIQHVSVRPTSHLLTSNGPTTCAREWQDCTPAAAKKVHDAALP
jgi:hypothetical protein